jgi:hypothetical protein
MTVYLGARVTAARIICYLEAQTLAPPYLAPCVKHPELRQALYLGSQFSFPPRLRQVAFHPAQKSALLSEKAGVARVVTAATVRAANVLRMMHILSLITPRFETSNSWT